MTIKTRALKTVLQTDSSVEGELEKTGYVLQEWNNY